MARAARRGTVKLSGLAALAAVAWLGCEPAAKPPGTSSPPESTSEPKATPATESVFEPPPLEALRTVKWVPQRVVDGLDLLRDHLKTRPAPLPDAEAQKLRNTDAQANQKIAAALGRLPESDAEVDWDATWNRWLFVEPKILNPLFFSTRYENELISVLYAGPFGFDWNLSPLADAEVVVEWSISEDRLMDRVVLRDDLTWTDGTPFTAHDIEFSYKMIMHPHVPCPAVRSGTDQLKGVKAYDGRTLVYFHREPLATNVWNVNFPIIPRHIYERTRVTDETLRTSQEHNRLNRAPVTNGPYRFVSWAPGQELVVERRPEWYEKDGKRIRRKPFFKTMRFRIIQDRSAALLAFRAGELDEIELLPEQWHAQTDSEEFHSRGAKINGEEWTFGCIAWCQKPIPDSPLFKDRRVREALSLAFPHEELLQKVCFGLFEPAPGIFHPSSWMGDPSLKPLKQDLRRARLLLAEAGWKDTDGDRILDKEVDGRRVKFDFALTIPSGSTLSSSVAALLKRDLEKLGVACSIREIEGSTIFSQSGEHKLQAAAYLWSTGVDPDTSSNLWTTKAYETGRNYTGFSNPRVDELYDQGRRELDPKQRAEIYREIARIVAAEHPCTFLYFRKSFYAIEKDLRGMNFSPRGPYVYTPGRLSIWKRKKG